MNQDTIVTLALDRRLDQAELVDALADDLDRLIDHLPGALEERRLRGSEPDHPAADILDVERTGARAEEAGERLRQLPELRQSLLEVVLANGDLDGSAAHDRSAGQADARLVQDSAHIVLQRQQLLPAHVVGVDLEQDASRLAGRGRARCGAAPMPASA